MKKERLKWLVIILNAICGGYGGDLQKESYPSQAVKRGDLKYLTATISRYA
jgi:hypothetical protein